MIKFIKLEYGNYLAVSCIDAIRLGSHDDQSEFFVYVRTNHSSDFSLFSAKTEDEARKWMDDLVARLNGVAD